VSSVINWIEQLHEVNTDEVEVMTNVNNAQLNFNADVVEKVDLSSEVLKNAKTAKYGYFAVPKVLE